MCDIKISPPPRRERYSNSLSIPRCVYYYTYILYYYYIQYIRIIIDFPWSVSLVRLGPVAWNEQLFPPCIDLTRNRTRHEQVIVSTSLKFIGDKGRIEFGDQTELAGKHHLFFVKYKNIQSLFFVKF